MKYPRLQVQVPSPWRAALGLQEVHWTPVQVAHVLLQPTATQFPAVDIENPELHLQVPSPWRAALLLQLVQPLGSVVEQVLQVLSQN